MSKNKKKLVSGFTLLEVTIVVGIASLILTLGSNLFIFSKQSARDVVRKIDIDQIRAGLEFYREEDSNRYYPEDLNNLLLVNGGYIDTIPDDPLQTVYDYYYTRDPDDPTNYILGAKLETGGPSTCGLCGPEQCNYCYSPLGLLITPTPTQFQPTLTPTETPGVPTATPTQTQVSPTATPTPGPTPIVQCNQIGNAYFDEARQKYTVTLGSNFSSSTWSILNNLDCSPTAGSGSIFTTRCVQLGTSTATVSYGIYQNTCEFSTVP